MSIYFNIATGHSTSVKILDFVKIPIILCSQQSNFSDIKNIFWGEKSGFLQLFYKYLAKNILISHRERQYKSCVFYDVSFYAIFIESYNSYLLYMDCKKLIIWLPCSKKKSVWHIFGNSQYTQLQKFGRNYQNIYFSNHD